LKKNENKDLNGLRNENPVEVVRRYFDHVPPQLKSGPRTLGQCWQILSTLKNWRINRAEVFNRGSVESFQGVHHNCEFLTLINKVHEDNF